MWVQPMGLACAGQSPGELVIYEHLAADLFGVREGRLLEVPGGKALDPVKDVYVYGGPYVVVLLHDVRLNGGVV